MKKILAFAALISLIPAVSQATLYKWTGTLGDSGSAFGSFDVKPDGSLKLATLSFDNIAWQGFRSQFDTITPTAGNTRMYVADCMLQSGDQYGEYSFWNNVDNPEDGTWWLGIGQNAVSGKIFSFGADSAPTPEPSSFVLMAVALAGLGCFRYRRNRIYSANGKTSA